MQVSPRLSGYRLLRRSERFLARSLSFRAIFLGDSAMPSERADAQLEFEFFDRLPANFYAALVLSFGLGLKLIALQRHRRVSGRALGVT
jgi:hypothetical protein